MNPQEFQYQIDHADSAEAMRRIGQAYLDGDVIKDLTAADAWLTRAVEANDPIESPIAMALIARRILGLPQVIPEEDLEDIRSRLPQALSAELQELQILLEIGEKTFDE